MANEHPTLQKLWAEATASGEIVSVTADSITISGDFSPGLGTYELRPGARVYVLNEHDAISLVPNPEAR